MLMILIYRVIFRFVDAIFVLNEDDEGLIRSAGMAPVKTPVVRLAGTGIDLCEYPSSPAPPGPLRLLLIARLLREKGIAEYVEAARLVKSRWPECIFELLGPFDSNPGAIFRRQIEEWQEEGVIAYLGETSDVRPFLSACSVYVLPSYREGMPRTILEALATGRAVITTRVPGCRETVIEGVNGYLVPPRDPAALAGTIGRFVADSALSAKMGAASRRLAEERFDVRRVNRTMLEAMGLGSPTQDVNAKHESSYSL
jgi:glycosyltransferase involved in cell wall biosynthesis